MCHLHASRRRMVILVAAVLSVLKSVNSHPQAGFAGDGAQGAFGRIPRLALPEPGDPTLARGPGQRKALVCRTQQSNWPRGHMTEIPKLEMHFIPQRVFGPSPTLKPTVQPLRTNVIWEGASPLGATASERGCANPCPGRPKPVVHCAGKQARPKPPQSGTQFRKATPSQWDFIHVKGVI